MGSDESRDIKNDWQEKQNSLNSELSAAGNEATNKDKGNNKKQENKNITNDVNKKESNYPLFKQHKINLDFSYKTYVVHAKNLLVELRKSGCINN